MCGIAGIINLSGQTSDISVHIKQMCDKIKHRGPDGEGFLFFKNDEVISCFAGDTPQKGINSNFQYSPKVDINSIGTDYYGAFGHRRLSILDLTEAGHQPMCTGDGEIWVTYNGEIYNYIELREELERDGFNFKTNTDTEVLLNAYQKWGVDCLNRFNGMWAFVILDKKKNILFGSRDRFGVKPFYYSLDSDHFTFASEQKAIVSLPFVSTTINSKAVFDYLVLGVSEKEEEGMFKNIFELMPSHSFIFDLNSKDLKKWKYYDLEYQDKWENFDQNKESEIINNSTSLVREAISLRLRSDAPVGSCLSGGLDSSAIVCTINKLLEESSIAQIGEHQQVFTACYDDPKYDESNWAKKVVGQTKTSWHKAFPTSELLLNELEHVTFIQDIPVFSSSTFSHYQVMKLANEKGIKVTLDGQGGDEVFAGYDPQVISYWFEIIKNFKVGKLLNEFNISERSIVSRSHLSQNILKYLILNYLPSSAVKEFYKKAAIYKYINPQFWDQHVENVKEVTPQVKPSLNKVLHEYLTGPKLKVLLKTSERNSMAHSVESRVPFADDINLIEYMFKIPSAYKIKNNVTKHLLREATNGILPEEVRQRTDKVGFSTPEITWLREINGDLKAYITDDLKEFLNVSKINKNWDNFFSDKADNTQLIWRLVNFAVWKKVYKL